MDFSNLPWIGDTNHSASDVVVGKEFTNELDTTFFQLDKKYSFDLQIIKKNQTGEVIFTKNFILTMNKKPSGGVIKTIPNVGLYNTTSFVITCENFIDDTTQTSDLNYYFYSIEIEHQQKNY